MTDITKQLQLEKEIETYAKETLAPAVNEAPHLASYIYKGIRKQFPKHIADKMIEATKKIVIS
jgi:hypothetical protein